MAAVARAALAAALAVIVLYVLFELRHALLTLYIATVLAILFDPLLELFRRLRVRGRRPSRGLATAMVVLVVVVALVVIALIIVPPIVSDAGRLETQWPEKSAHLFDWVHAHLPFTRSLTAATVAGWAKNAAGRTPVLTLGSTAMDVLTTLLLAIYMLADGPRALDWIVSLLPAHARPKFRTALQAGGRRMQGWVGGQGILMLVHGGSALVTFWILGLPYFFALALFAGVINIIPVLGPILTLVAASLVAVMNSPGKLLGVVIFYLAYHNMEGMYLQPRIMSSAVGIPGVAIVAALVIGDELAGFIGMALSVPTAVLIAEIRRQYLPADSDVGQ